ncbi:hypothetical protein [Thermococcus sp. 5-4]|uniref:hypothetical protein n=1 Tax=Thermococcus sp. 5-4 TaxID=2008440 RepID=UPI000B49FA36|nr:hypothetical protein [Thermococcus sp. 5-4]ASA77522.1 hypothetical protein CDI07_04165 [Thermococcus sp. 5-4]
MVLTRKRTGIVEIEEKRRFRTVKRREQVDVYTTPTGENTTVFAKIAQMAAGLPDLHPTHTGLPQGIIGSFPRRKHQQRWDMTSL